MRYILTRVRTSDHSARFELDLRVGVRVMGTYASYEFAEAARKRYTEGHDICEGPEWGHCDGVDDTVHVRIAEYLVDSYSIVDLATVQCDTPLLFGGEARYFE